METTRTNITLPNTMHEALAQVADERGASMANCIRMAVADWLKAQGHEVQSTVSWGGDRVSRPTNGHPVP